MNVTAKGAGPFDGVAVKAATGGRLGLVTVMDVVAWSVRPNWSVTVSVTVKVPGSV